MQKEELLHLHMLLIQIKKYYESMNGEEIQTEKYSSLLVSPVHIHKNKVLHKKAILALGEEIVQHIHQHEMSRVGFLADTASSRVAVEH
ncbi:MAG: UPF0058 family protein [Methanomicrobiales archaeon]|nr:UPF0058 family protein [Methanomicrobiales archaeon]